MALVLVPNLQLYAVDTNWTDTTNQALDATGEYLNLIGYVRLQNGNASTKTVSAAGGGSIVTRTGAITFANGSSVFEVGLQDVGADGFQDGTFDVKAVYTGGTDTITATAYHEFVMTTGTKTLTDGQLLAVVFQFTTRAGADSVSIDRLSNSMATTIGLIPYATVNTGSPSKGGSQVPFAMIRCDDGTVAWIYGMSVPPYNRVSTGFNSGSATDEYLVSFTPTFKCQIAAVGVDLSDVDATDDLEVRIYSDPFGTPALIGDPLTIDPDQTGQVANIYSFSNFVCTPFEATPGTVYGVSVRPTTANNVAIGYFDLTTGFDDIKRMSLFGDTVKLGGRADTTGAFSVVQDYFMPQLFLYVSKLDDGAGSGGGGGSVFGAVGGVIA